MVENNINGRPVLWGEVLGVGNDVIKVRKGGRIEEVNIPVVLLRTGELTAVKCRYSLAESVESLKVGQIVRCEVLEWSGEWGHRLRIWSVFGTTSGTT